MVDIVSRREWGARAVSLSPPLRMPTPELWFHHSATEQHGPRGVREIQAFHIDVKHWHDIAYSFLVDNADGVIYEGRGAGRVGAHTEGHNSKSHGICVIGNLQANVLSAVALDSVAALVTQGHEWGWWPARFTGGHQQAKGASTACPGLHGMAALRQLDASGYLVAEPFKEAPVSRPTPVNRPPFQLGETSWRQDIDVVTGNEGMGWAPVPGVPDDKIDSVTPYGGNPRVFDGRTPCPKVGFCAPVVEGSVDGCVTVDEWAPDSLVTVRVLFHT